MMETIQGFQCHDFWRNSRIHPFETTPYHSNDILPQTHFEEIIKSNTITNYPPSEYKDIVWEVIQLIYEWNHNMKIFFSQISLLFG